MFLQVVLSAVICSIHGQFYPENGNPKMALYAGISTMLAELDVKCLVYITSRKPVSFDSAVPVIVVDSSDAKYVIDII